jgi:hypothetical protein
MSEFAKLAAIHQVLLFVSVDGEKSFATLRAVKTKVRNSLGEGDKWENLNIVVRGMSAGKEIGDWNYRGIGDPLLFSSQTPSCEGTRCLEMHQTHCCSQCHS